MVADWIILGGLFYALTKGRNTPEATQPTPDANGDDAGRSGGNSTPPPQPITPEGDDYRVELVATGEQNEIQMLEARRGVMYDDGSGGYSWESMGYIRGNLTQGFVTANADAGTITFTIAGQTYSRVLVYKTIADAQTADEIPEDDPSGPQKQPEPEDDEDDGAGGLTQPGYGGLGGGNYWTGPVGGGGY